MVSIIKWLIMGPVGYGIVEALAVAVVAGILYSIIRRLR